MALQFEQTGNESTEGVSFETRRAEGAAFPLEVRLPIETRGRRLGTLTLIWRDGRSEVDRDEALALEVVTDALGKASAVLLLPEEGAWLRCELEAKNVLSVPGAGVLSIEEASTPAREGPMNQVAVGTGTPYTGRGGGGGGEQPDYAAQAEAAAAVAEAQQAAQAQEQAGQEVTAAAGVPRSGFGRNAAGGRRGARHRGRTDGSSGTAPAGRPY